MANEVKQFKYPGPADPRARSRGPEKGRSYDLIYNDTVASTVQIMEKGQGNPLHSHTNEDGYWLVLEGRARFFDETGGTVAHLGPFEGIFIPRYTRYGFENVDDEQLQILRVSTLPDAAHSGE